jgi:hypothetical protein
MTSFDICRSSQSPSYPLAVTVKQDSTGVQAVLTGAAGVYVELRKARLTGFLQALRPFHRPGNRGRVTGALGGRRVPSMHFHAMIWPPLRKFSLVLRPLGARMSADERETVAGPIDVAVLSKGEGFVWIKRKDPIAAARTQSPIAAI